jgi:site-specific DNA recombinase
VLQLASRAYELFKSSEVEEKRQLIKLVLSNLRVEGEKVLWDVIKPFDLITKSSDCNLWLGREDSNLRMTVPKTVALPLGDAPRIIYRSYDV